VNWEIFRPILKEVRHKPHKNNAGPRGYDAVLLFKILILQPLYNLADEALEFQILDASIVRIPVQRNNREENKEIKKGNISEKGPAKKRIQKDTDARWTKKSRATRPGQEFGLV
jgi:hypothetical protein